MGLPVRRAGRTGLPGDEQDSASRISADFSRSPCAQMPEVPPARRVRGDGHLPRRTCRQRRTLAAGTRQLAGEDSEHLLTRALGRRRGGDDLGAVAVPPAFPGAELDRRRSRTGPTIVPSAPEIRCSSSWMIRSGRESERRAALVDGGQFAPLAGCAGVAAARSCRRGRGAVPMPRAVRLTRPNRQWRRACHGS